MRTAVSSAVLCLVLLTTASHAPAQPATRGSSSLLERQLDSLLDIVDRRLPDHSVLRRYLHDDASMLRERAAIACGTIQDTLLLEDLLPLLRNHALPVRTAAAFAIGQTAQYLSAATRTAVENKILALLHSGFRTTQLIEESGKFGSSAFLDSLAAFYHTSQRVFPDSVWGIAVARFAIRGVTTHAGMQTLLDLLHPEDRTAWQVVYALQRAGTHPETREAVSTLALLAAAPDPLVRMHLATVAGTVHDDSTGLAIIRALATDGDWRVRTNAAKALCKWIEHRPADALPLLAELLADSCDHVAIATCQALASSDTLLAYLRNYPDHAISSLLNHLADEKPTRSWQCVAAALPVGTALHLAPVEHRMPNLLASPLPLRPYALSALGHGSGTRTLSLLIEYCSIKGPHRLRPVDACAAMDAMLPFLARNPGLPDSMRTCIFTTLGATMAYHDVAVTTTAATALRDTVFRGRTNIPLLRKALQRLTLPADVEAIQEIVQTLRAWGDSTATAPRTPISRRVKLSDIHAMPDTVHMVLGTEYGRIRIDLYKNLAPFTVAAIASLAGSGFYDSRGGHPVTFHRVVPNFVVQGGDPRGDGWGGPGFSLRSEFSLADYETGTVGIASAGKDTEGSQFFITHSPQPHLEGRYTIIGRVVEGMDHVDRLGVGDRIISVRVESPR